MVKRIFTHTYILIGVAVVMTLGIAGWFFVRNGADDIETLTVEPQDFLQQISVSGKVIASERVDLAFSQTGQIALVHARVGDTVRAGSVLVVLENGEARAEVAQKQAALKAAQAKLESLREGMRQEQLAVDESKVASAQTALTQTDHALTDALRNAFVNADDAIHYRVDQFFINPRSTNPKLNFTTADNQLISDIEWNRFLLEPILIAWERNQDVVATQTRLQTIKTFLDNVARAVNALSASSAISQTTIDGYRNDIATARANVNAAASALTTALTNQTNAATALEIAQKILVLEQAGTPQKDIDEQAARVAIAEADLARAQAALRKTLMIAPFDGIVTNVEAKVGEAASLSVSAITMISAGTLLIESFVPELNAPLLEVGDEAHVTLDAYGADMIFAATVLSLDPAETIRDGVTTYRAKLGFHENDERIKPGMNAALVITTEKKSNVIAIPQGIIDEQDNKKIVRVKEGKAIRERIIEIGSISSAGMAEVLSGLTSGEKIVISPR
mgnify:CR=1 FL=1